MGIVNVTPDSFSDGGRYIEPAQAVAHARQLVEEGADILDVGGESSRPGAQSVSTDEELHRVLPVVEGLAGLGVPLSIDTVKPEVMRRAVAAVPPSSTISPPCRRQGRWRRRQNRARPSA